MHTQNIFTFTSKIWLYPGQAAWHFVTLPQKISQQINENFGYLKQGWGSIQVQVCIKNVEWETSIFPDKKSGSYLLPLKAEIRKKTEIQEGDEVEITVEVKFVMGS